MNRRHALKLIAAAPLALAAEPVRSPQKLSAFWYETKRVPGDYLYRPVFEGMTRAQLDALGDPSQTRIEAIFRT